MKKIMYIQNDSNIIYDEYDVMTAFKLSDDIKKMSYDEFIANNFELVCVDTEEPQPYKPYKDIKTMSQAYNFRKSVFDIKKRLTA